MKSLEWALTQIKPLFGVEDNWDGYHADRPTTSALAETLSILDTLKYMYKITEPIVSCVRDGGVALTWEVNAWKDKEIYIEIEPNDKRKSVYVYTRADKSIEGKVWLNKEERILEPRLKAIFRLIFGLNPNE